MASAAPFDRQAIIHDLYASKDVAAAIGKMEPAHLREELMQDMFVVLCGLSDARLQEMHDSGQLKLYLFGVMHTMARSDRSTFYNTHRRERHVPAEAVAVAQEPLQERRWTEIAGKALELLDPYEADIFRIYVEMGNSCKPVADATGISERSVRFVVAQAREKLKKHLKRAA